MQFLKKFAGTALFFPLFFFFAFAGVSPAEPQGEGKEYSATKTLEESSLSTDSRAFLDSLNEALFALENIWYYGVSPETREKVFARIREALNEELAELDIHTSIIPPSSVKGFVEEMRGEFVGIGVSIAVHPDDTSAAMERLKNFSERLTQKYHENNPEKLGKLMNVDEKREIEGIRKIANTIGAHGVAIQEVFPGSPAEKAGIKAGSTIHSVNGTAIAGMLLSDAIDLIKGKDGTNLTLGIASEKAPPLEIVVTRGRVDVPMVQSAFYKVTEKNSALLVGYVKIRAFEGKAAEQFAEKVAGLTKDGATALIIDVRGNPGGSVDIVHDVLASLMPPGLVILYEETKDGKVSELKVGDFLSIAPRIFTGDIVVLTDGHSASGSEILAGALHDYNRATLVGSKTYGKGSMQYVYPLPDGSLLKVTTALYRIPSDKLIDKVGIEPDIKAEDDPKTPEDEVVQAALTFLSNR